MVNLSHHFAATAAGSLLFASMLCAQSNAVPGIDVGLYDMRSAAAYGRRGPAYPNGETGFVIGHSFCNSGIVHVPWEDQNPDGSMTDTYPKIAFLIARESDGRIVQVSGRSFLKHSGTPFNFSSGPCAPCQSGPSATMRIGCSDTYGPGFNGNRNNLGPAEEIDPWLGTWDSVGSYFDRGDPAVAGGAAADNFKSLNSSMTFNFDDIKNRITCREVELAVPGAQFFGQVQIVIQGEPGDNRDNNQIARPLDITYNSMDDDWSIGLAGTAIVGSVLDRWSGSTSAKARNGDDDGHFRVAVKVTPNGDGTWHYEYAVQNVDNARGAATLRIPLAAGASVTNVGFHDIDGDPLNDWVFSQSSTEIQFGAGVDNALDWNNFYNFWFDCSEAPSTGSVALDQARPGPGNFTVFVDSQIPSGVPIATVTSIGAGCGDCASSDYELFGSASGFDLQSKSMTLDFDGTNYTVQAGTTPFLPAAGTTITLGLGGEQVQALPFSLPYPGGATNAVVISSTGYVSAGFGNGADFSPTVGELLSGIPRWAAAWHGLNPGGGGTIQVDSSANLVVITFTDVPSFGLGGTNTFQYQFESDGDVHIHWGSMNPSGGALLVGWSPGGGASDPGSRDFSAGLPTPRTLCALSFTGLSHSASAAPVLGSSLALTTDNIPAGTAVGATLVFFQLATPPIDLGVIDMPGCELYGTGASSDLGFTNPAASVGLPITVPNDMSLDGMTVVTQTFTVSPPLTPLGVIASNGLVLFLAPQ